jgi:hypothetical protein
VNETKRMFAYLVGGLGAAVLTLLAARHWFGVSEAHMDTFLVIAAWIPVVIYFPAFSTRRWMDTGPGRALWVKSLGNFVLINMAMAVLIFGPDYPLRPEVRLAGFTIFAVGMWYLLFTLIRSPRGPEESRHPGPQSPQEQDRRASRRRRERSSPAPRR